MKNLKIIRKHHKMTQQQVSSLLGISRTTYTQYETDVSRPDFKTIEALKNIFQVPTDFLLENPPFDNFSEWISHSDLLISTMDKLLANNFHTLCADPKSNLNTLITLISITIKKIELTGTNEKPHIEIFPLLPLEDLEQIFSSAHADIKKSSKSATDLEDDPKLYSLINNYHKLNDDGKNQLVIHSDIMVRSGIYKQNSK